MKKNKKLQNSAQTKRVPKFKILDAVIILLILTSVIGIYFRYNVLDMITNRKDIKDYTVSFSIEDIRYTTEEYIHEGDVVYYADNGEVLGTMILSSDNSNLVLDISPASKFFVDDNGTTVEVFYPNLEYRVNANGRMTCRGTRSDEVGFLVNGTRHLAEGQTVEVKTELVSVRMTILEIALAE